MGTPTIPFGLPLSLLRLRRLGAREEMIGVDKIDDIRKLGRNGATVASIARDTGVSEPTVRKYLREPDLSERPPRSGGRPSRRCSSPSRRRSTRGCWRTGAAGSSSATPARKVFDRLVAEEGFRGSYSTVQRYVRRRRGELAAELDAREAQGFLLLDWLPGECQVDFGQADFRVRGVVTRGHFLVWNSRTPTSGSRRSSGARRPSASARGCATSSSSSGACRCVTANLRFAV